MMRTTAGDELRQPPRVSVSVLQAEPPLAQLSARSATRVTPMKRRMSIPKAFVAEGLWSAPSFQRIGSPKREPFWSAITRSMQTRVAERIVKLAGRVSMKRRQLSHQTKCAKSATGIPASGRSRLAFSGGHSRGSGGPPLNPAQLRLIAYHSERAFCLPGGLRPSAN